jgi:hypothetical protein
MGSQLVTNSSAVCFTLGGETFERHLASIAEGGPAAISERLDQLDREWTSGRLVKATTGVLILAGLFLTVLANLWFAIVPAVGGLLLAQYSFARRSWLGESFSRMGYRTGVEIDRERVALKALRGDFKHLPTVHDIEDQDAISRLEGEGGMVVEPDDAKLGPREAVRQVVEATRHEPRFGTPLALPHEAK